MLESIETRAREMQARDIKPGDRIPYDVDPRGHVVVRTVAVGTFPARPGQVVIATDGAAPVSSHQPDALVTVLTTPYRPQTNDLIDITIRRGRVKDTSATMLDGSPAMVVYDAGGKAHMVVPLDSPNVTITRVAPAAPEWWPPQVGDLAQDGTGSLWFGHRFDANRGVMFIAAESDDVAVPVIDQHQLLEDYGTRLRLVHREKQGGVS